MDLQYTSQRAYPDLTLGKLLIFSKKKRETRLRIPKDLFFLLGTPSENNPRTSSNNTTRRSCLDSGQVEKTCPVKPLFVLKI